eukprot:8556212-Ditylum_brightwellii.AAC.1
MLLTAQGGLGVFPPSRVPPYPLSSLSSNQFGLPQKESNCTMKLCTYCPLFNPCLRTEKHLVSPSFANVGPSSITKPIIPPYHKEGRNTAGSDILSWSGHCRDFKTPLRTPGPSANKI